MKRLLIVLVMLVFAIPAFADGPFVVDASYDAAVAYLEVADRVFVGPDGTYANKLGEVTITGADLSVVDGTTDGRALQIEAQEITASGTGAADTMGIYDVDTTTVLAYWPITTQGMITGYIYNFATVKPITFRDVTQTP